METSNIDFRSRWDKTGAERAGISLDIWELKRISGLKWCSRCEEWRTLAKFDRSKLRRDGHVGPCKICKGYGLSERSKLAWTLEEKKELWALLGTFTAPEIVKKMNRSPRAVSHMAGKLGASLDLRSEMSLQLRDLKEALGITSAIFETWIENGLGFRRARHYRIISPTVLRGFIKKRPEAYDILSGNEEDLSLVGIDLEGWPEPPTFKVISCSGFVCSKTGVEVKHDKVWTTVDLYCKKIVCPVCVKSQKQWANGYTNTWDPNPYIGEGLPPGAWEKQQIRKRK